MPLPFILGGLALATAVYGAKKGFDAKDDFNEAEQINIKARDMYDEAEESLNQAREETNEKLKLLGELKLNSYGYIIQYVDEYNKIQNREHKNFISETEQIESDKIDKLLYSENAKLELREIVHGGTTALGAGGLVGLASYGAVGTLATASTGTAIAGLSGVAATNATLAWLGGGALSAGGFGIAGGTAILGGIIAGPVLAIGGMIMSSKAEAAKEDAYTNLFEAKVACEEMLTAETKIDGISKRVLELDDNISKLNILFQKSLIDFINVLNKKRWIFFGNTNWEKMSEKDKKVIMYTENIAKTLFNLLETQLLDNDGDVSKDSKIMINKTESLLENLSN